ncbi:efflux RND transporter periplasmic adaptor subunit [Psychrobacillus antarcticus]|uniref:efflux RND transporter periplasmic adaptor subunit n=1 Tax=Psychrobacillus antarcticus TaxID=2879115 RepID=UPI00240889D7|nr:efflux RND transporter periplasmic adaptor subunit [Psychrobacillus antarcticus]
MNKWLTIGISIVVATFIGANAILIYSDKSQISRTFYVSEYDRVNENTYAEELEKESIVVPANELSVTIDVEAVNDIVVAEGDYVEEGTDLATLKTDSAEEQRLLWETEQQAYMQEQSELLSIISDLESERDGADSSSSSDGQATGGTADEIVDVNVQVDVNVSQDGNFAQGIAEAKQKLAEVDRKLQIVDAQLAQDSGALSLLSPLSGTVSSIEERNGKYFILLYGNEKSVITYVKESEWHDMEEGQNVKNYSTHREGVVEGSILVKTQVPANASKWLTAYEQFERKTHEPVYEVRIQLAEQLETLPFAANLNSVIITNQAENAVQIKSQWLLNRSDTVAEVYTLSSEGRIARTPVTVPFDLKQYAILSEGLSNGNVVLNADQKTDGAEAFLPFPVDLPTWNSIKSISWKDYVKYLTYK